MAGSIDSLIQTINGTVQLTNGINFIGSDATEINTNTIYGQIEAYTKCPAVQSAIELKASLHSTLKIAAINDSGRWLGGNQGTEIEKRTIKEDLKKLYYNNPEQSYAAFEHQKKVMLHIFGICYIQKVPIIGFKDLFSYYIIPNDIINPYYGYKPKYDSQFNAIPEKYIVNVPNGQLELQSDEVFIERDRMQGFGVDRSHISRLVALKEPISAILSANQMFTQLIADGGARGGIGLGAKDSEMSLMLDKDKRLMQKELESYGKLRGNLKYIVTKGALSYTPFTSSIVDMQLPENLLAMKIYIWGAFGIPNAFVVNEARFQVMPEARKEIFNACVTPEGKIMNDNNIRLKGIAEREWKYVADDSHHDFKMKDLKDSSIAFSQASAAIIPLIEGKIVTRQQALDYFDPYLR